MQGTDLQAFYAASVVLTGRLRVASAEDFDDLVQEGVVAAWEASQRPTRDPLTYAKVAARRQIQRVAMGRQPMTGGGKPGSKTYDQSRQATSRVALEDAGDPPARDEFSAVELRLEVEKALEGLDQRDRVIALGVGADKTWGEVAPLVGLAPVSVKNRWNRITKPLLREELAHLEGVA